MGDSSRKSLSKPESWRVIFAWVLVSIALTFTVSSISYDLGQASREAEVEKANERYEYGEDVRGKLREARDTAQDKSLLCIRALDQISHEYAHKGNILQDVYLADTPEEMERAKVRVDQWHNTQDAVNDRIDKITSECVDHK